MRQTRTILICFSLLFGMGWLGVSFHWSKDQHRQTADTRPSSGSRIHLQSEPVVRAAHLPKTSPIFDPTTAQRANMVNEFLPKTTLQDLARRQLPTLQVAGDVLATRSNISKAALLARNGDAGAAIAISRVMSDPLLTSKMPREDDERQRKEMIPGDIPDDSLYWLQLAADRGDPMAQIMFVKAVMSSTRLGAGPNFNLDTSRLELEEERSVRYLNALISGGVADSLTLLAAAYNEALLGLTYDAAKAHAALIVLEAAFKTPETKQRLNLSLANLRAGEVDRASALVASGQWRPAI